ncbi:MAG: hypothetical protein IKC31_02600 [Clostridia bacterium]|nr:hypothetical protein [Clostridia bacterium]
MDNYIKEETGGVRMQTAICDRVVTADLSEDLSLPDYQPEIKRLLRVRATVHPADKYLGAGEAEFSGNVDYCVLYAGNDGALYSLSESGEYRFSVPMEGANAIDLGEGIVCDVQITPDMVTGRVAAPRKLGIKCRLRARVRMLGVQQMENALPKDSEGVEALRGSATVARIFLGTSDGISLGDEITMDLPDTDLRVIASEGQIFVTEASAGSGVVNCRGEVCLKLLVSEEGEGMRPMTLLRRIPFSQEVPVDGAEVNCDCTAHGICTAIGVTVEEGKLLCDVTLRLQARAQRNEEISFLRDVYSTKRECQGRIESFTLPQAISAIGGNFSVNQTMTLEEAGIRANQSIWDASATAILAGMEQERGKVYLTGRLRCHAVLLCEGEVSAQEFEIPFRYANDLPQGATVTDYQATPTVLSCRVRMDGERIHADAEVAISATLMGEKTVQMLTEALFGDAIAHKACSYTVCYPSREDTLWSVAKRYHKPIEAIATRNALPSAPMADTTASLAGVSYLLV